MFNHILILNIDDFDRCLSQLGNTYDKLKRMSYRHDEFIPNTPQNRKLVKMLQYLQFLTSYEYETQTQHSARHIEKNILLFVAE